jgi:hypothetical protein
MVQRLTLTGRAMLETMLQRTAVTRSNRPRIAHAGIEPSLI